MVFVPSILGFILGSIAVLAVEAVLILYAVRRLSRGGSSTHSGHHPSRLFHSPQPFDPRHSVPSSYNKQGVLWILEPEKVPKVSATAEQSKKSEIIEVSPVRKLAKIHDRMLMLAEGDGSHTKVMLKDCQVVAVSATSLPSRKWAKRYSIKLESKKSVLYRGSKVLHIYAETSWEKEAWCRALRLASFEDVERVLWFSKLIEEFRTYMKSLAEGYPSLMKSSIGYHGGSFDKCNRSEDPPSKVRQLWKKISKKHTPPSNDDKRISDKSRVVQETNIKKISIPGKLSNGCVEDCSSVCSSTSSLSRSSSYLSDISDADAADKFITDDGTLCWNLIVSRLFFDATSNVDIKSSLKARIQRTLTNMRTPSYIGEIICTDVDPGSLPPYIHGMRTVPSEMDDLGALEMDVEYCGGLVLFIEARLEVGELDLPNGTVESSVDASSVGEETTDLLKEFKQLQGDCKPSDGVASKEHKYAGDPKLGNHKNGKTATASSGSMWKSMLNSVAKHVSQVPLSLAIRVAALRGTLQLRIKPPPSDQLWFGFTSTPDIHFELESSVGDHRITNGRVASFFGNRFKAAIRETMVLPNCESAHVPWMLAEKDDWVPRKTAPFIFLNRDPPSAAPVPATTTENSSSHSSELKFIDRDHQESKQLKLKKSDSKRTVQEGCWKPPRSSTLSRSLSEGSSLRFDSNNTLFHNEGSQVQRENNPEHQSFSRYISYKEIRNSEDEDGRPKKAGKKSKMFDLGKRMGEKIEEKKRHIEEKSRHIVEKMRGP